MSFAHMTRMLISDHDGWSDLSRIHATPRELMVTYVLPMSLIPPLMYAYAEVVAPGRVFPALAPHLSLGEITLVGVLFVLAELAMVELMANFIHQRSESASPDPSYERAFALAAVAPTPLWLASLALFIPQLWVNVAAMAFAWVASAMMIRHGVRPLLGIEDDALAHRMATTLTVAGVLAWVGLLVVLELLVSFVVGWR
ncbi:MAG TPA: Yip1 family protein [Rhodocyclaceae bacterium]|nr:Yip1 family protein [Rhodocyclaceae bacterium]